MWEELREQYSSQVEFIEVDHDDDEGDAFAREHGIPYQPGFIIYDSTNTLVYNELGPYSGDEMRELVLSVLPEEN